MQFLISHDVKMFTSVGMRQIVTHQLDGRSSYTIQMHKHKIIANGRVEPDTNLKRTQNATSNRYLTTMR